MTQIVAECRHRQFKPPALVIIGESARCSAEATRMHPGPLAGKRILVTSPSQSTGRICALIRETGAEPIPYPTAIRSRFDDVEGWRRFVKLVNDGGLVYFSRELEVSDFFDEMIAHGLDIRNLGRFRIIALGEATDAALVARGIKADWILQNVEPQTLTACVSRLMPDRSLPIVWPRGSSGKCHLENTLLQYCSGIVPLIISSDSTAIWDSHWKDELMANPPDYILFTGTAEVEGFVEIVGSEMASALANKSRVAAASDLVADMLCQYELSVKVKPNASSIEALIKALVRHSQDQVSESVV